jgi:hypothetical protein
LAENRAPLHEFRTKLDYVKLEDIETNPNNPREPSGKEKVQDLKESIKRVGILVPLVVYQKPGSKSKFILVEGERRYRACHQLYDETKETRFGEVPVNILRTQPDAYENLQTMFNVHTKRRKWSRAAQAEAQGKLSDMGKTKPNTRKLVDLTGLNEVAVEENRTYLKFPKDIRELAFEGKLNEYYLILLGRNLRAIQATFPQIFEKYDWETVSRSLIEKVQIKIIRRTRDFNNLSSLANTCIEYKNEHVFLEAFDKLMQTRSYSIDDMVTFVDRELGYRVNETFRQHCLAFKDSLLAHAKHRGYELEKPTFAVLAEIGRIISDLKTS